MLVVGAGWEERHTHASGAKTYFAPPHFDLSLKFAWRTVHHHGLLPVNHSCFSRYQWLLAVHHLI